jgi:adenosine deaminase
MEITEEIKSNIYALPKVELHIHLEACTSLGTLEFLANRNNLTLPKHLVGKEDIYFSTFEEFVANFYAICHAIQTEEDFKFIARDLVNYVKKNNIIYCEVSWTPFLYLQRGFSFSKVMSVLNNEIALNNLTGCIYFIIDTQRDHGTETGDFVFNKVLETKDVNITGIGLTGQEQGFPASAYTPIYRRMRDEGFGCTAHAGEYGAADDIWQCLTDLEVKRIGHGIRAIDDPLLIEYIWENNIHLEISPTSNVRLHRVENYPSHPIKKFIEMKLNVGVNSDDPGIFNTGLSDEYINLLSAFNLDITILKQCNIDAVKASFANTKIKKDLLGEIEKNWS